MENTFTKVLDKDDEDGFGQDVWVCNDCGAHEQRPEAIKHHKSCQPGDSEKWKQYYAEFSEED